jgi:CyaY protein
VGMSEEVLSEQEFDARADEALRALDRALNEEAGLEADLESGILTIEFEDGLKYIVNSHRAARQIWMAADSSAWHYSFRPADGRWVASKSGDELWATLGAVIGKKLGRKVVLAAAK